MVIHPVLSGLCFVMVTHWTEVTSSLINHLSPLRLKRCHMVSLPPFSHFISWSCYISHLLVLSVPFPSLLLLWSSLFTSFFFIWLLQLNPFVSVVLISLSTVLLKHTDVHMETHTAQLALLPLSLQGQICAWARALPVGMTSLLLALFFFFILPCLPLRLISLCHSCLSSVWSALLESIRTTKKTKTQHNNVFIYECVSVVINRIWAYRFLYCCTVVVLKYWGGCVRVKAI